VRSGLDLPLLFSNINDYLCQALPERSFVTMAGVLLDLGTGGLTCVNAGHPPPMMMSHR